MNPIQNKWESRRIKYRFHVEIVAGHINTEPNKREDV
jgi:hypothetical protein